MKWSRFFWAARSHKVEPMTKPIVLIAEELSPATVAALGPDFEVVNVDGTDRPALLSAITPPLTKLGS